MAIYRANTQSEGYCHKCRQDVDPQKLQQCVKCKNWFCPKDIAFVEDTSSLVGQLAFLCVGDQGKPVLM